MSTINRMVSSGFTSSGNSVKNEITELRKKMGELSKNSSLTAEEKKEKQKEYKDKIDELNEQLESGRNAQIAAAQNSIAGIFGGFNSDSNQTGFGIFFGANASMSSLKAMNSARIGIENRARTLMSEIRMDNVRGIDTSAKREQLSNLTSNLSIMDKNLSNNINKSLETPKAKQSSPSVADKINAELKAMQEKAEKSVQEKYGTPEQEPEKTK
ncbi:MAG: FlxA-like family protein [Oscillospiraceae bacterium]|nr:FlxA-like family protein [Oscillospiraceae bacterium]